MSRWTGRAIGAGAFLFGVVFLYVLLVSRRDERHHADAIIVLGAAHYNGRPSGVLRARLDHAADLYARGLAPVIVVTGGRATGDRVSEATVSQQYLVNRDVPQPDIVVQPVGSNSHESLAAAAEWMHDRGLDTVLLVSDPFHMARLRVQARALDLAPYTSPTRTSPISLNARRELRYFAAETVKLPVVWVQSLLR